MPLNPGTTLGPYQIAALLGAGGMGEVYRAKDTRLDRTVAIKVLPAHLSADDDLRKRFEQEAHTISGLNHPYICALYDIGAQNGTHYLVMEYLEGETLRSRLQNGPISVRKALEFAVQIANGLSAAHEKGIVHRDLKPENIFVTREDRIKLLDFGLAHYTPGEPSSDLSLTPTRVKMTEPGMVMGTVGYMSPEQVRGQQIDSRSDIFSFGAVLYEMMAGRSAFARETAPETMTAILREEPQELQSAGKNIPPAVALIVQRCLEKKPDLRFQTAQDLAFALQMTSQPGSVSTEAIKSPAIAGRKTGLWIAVASILLVAGAALAYFWGHSAPEIGKVNFRQLTFRRGYVQSAAFAPDGHTIIYSAMLSGGPPRLYITRTDSLESTPLDLPSAELLSLSQNSEMAILLSPRYEGNWVRSGILARVPMSGGAPREILENVIDADFVPDGTNFIVSHMVGASQRLESPIGKVLYETNGWINCPRISRAGKIAFLDHPIFGDDRGFVALLENGKITHISREYSSIDGLAWSPNGNELWFTGSHDNEDHEVWALKPGSPERILLRAPTRVRLNAIDQNGEALITSGEWGAEIGGVLAGDTHERDLSWYGDEDLGGISDDGATIAATQLSQGAGANYQTYFRRVDGSATVLLGPGSAVGISPDGKSILSLLPSGRQNQLLVYPTGPGEIKKFDLGNLEFSGSNNYVTGWTADGRLVGFLGKEPGKPQFAYTYNFAKGETKALTDKETLAASISPDGKSLVAVFGDGHSVMDAVFGGNPQPVPGMQSGDYPLQWEKSGQALFVWDRSFPAEVFRIDLATGKRELWKNIVPADPIGVLYGRVILAPDGNHYAYRYRRILNRLYLAEGFGQK
jgi:hypothetical protein